MKLSHSIRRQGAGYLAAVAVLLAASVGAAQPADELARARAAYNKALSLEVAGDWSGALARLEDVAKVKLTPQVRFHMARCKEQLGRLTEALGDYRLAEDDAEQAHLAELEQITAARVAIEKRVPKLVVELGPGLAGSTVELDGVELGGSRLGQEIPVDPGARQLLLRLPDGREFSQPAVAITAEVTRVTLTVPAGLPKPASTGPRTKAVVAVDVAPSHHPTWVWVALGAGTLGAVTAGAAYYVRSSAQTKLDDGCRGSVCPERLHATQDRGQLASTVLPIALGVGAAGLGAAAVGWFLPSRPKATESHAQGISQTRFNVIAAPGYSGVHVSASF